MKKIILRLLLAVSFGFVAFIAYCHMSMLYMCDVSLAPLGTECKEEVHLISYADGPDVFKKNQHFQAFSALNRGVDHIHMYRRKDLDAAFCNKNKEILAEKKGAGIGFGSLISSLKRLKVSHKGRS